MQNKNFFVKCPYEAMNYNTLSGANCLWKEQEYLSFLRSAEEANENVEDDIIDDLNNFEDDNISFNEEEILGENKVIDD